MNNKFTPKSHHFGSARYMTAAEKDMAEKAKREIKKKLDDKRDHQSPFFTAEDIFIVNRND